MSIFFTFYPSPGCHECILGKSNSSDVNNGCWHRHQWCVIKYSAIAVHKTPQLNRNIPEEVFFLLNGIKWTVCSLTFQCLSDRDSYERQNKVKGILVKNHSTVYVWSLTQAFQNNCEPPWGLAFSVLVMHISRGIINQRIYYLWHQQECKWINCPFGKILFFNNGHKEYENNARLLYTWGAIFL